MAAMDRSARRPRSSRPVSTSQPEAVDQDSAAKARRLVGRHEILRPTITISGKRRPPQAPPIISVMVAGELEVREALGSKITGRLEAPAKTP